MKNYIDKYYPLLNGEEVEYTTTVEAEDKTSAEKAVRIAYIEQLKRVHQMVKEYNMIIVGNDPEDIPKNIEYAYRDMRIEII